MDICQKIQQVDRLPSPPALAAELLELTASPDVKISQIAALIERDPALTTKLLKQCNSAAYGLRQKVASVDRATVMLGIKQIKCLALGFLILTDSEMAKAEGFNYPLYWKRASVTAVAGKKLIERIDKPKSGDAFVSGLLQDIGVLLLQHVAPNEYAADRKSVV